MRWLSPVRPTALRLIGSPVLGQRPMCFSRAAGTVLKMVSKNGIQVPVQWISSQSVFFPVCSYAVLLQFKRMCLLVAEYLGWIMLLLGDLWLYFSLFCYYLYLNIFKAFIVQFHRPGVLTAFRRRMSMGMMHANCDITLCSALDRGGCGGSRYQGGVGMAGVPWKPLL